MLRKLVSSTTDKIFLSPIHNSESINKDTQLENIPGYLNPKIQEYFNHEIKFSKINHKVVLFEEEYIVGIRFPLPVGVHPDVEKVETTIQNFIKKHGLYKGLEEGVARSKFAWLPGLVLPHLSTRALEGVSLYFVALFAHDDALDIHTSEGEIDPKKLQKINDRMEAVLKGASLQEDDLPRIKAIKEVFEEYFRPIQLTGLDFTPFWTTLHEYLQSTVSEARHIVENVPITEQTYIKYRPLTSGIDNAFAAICLFLGVDISKLFAEEINLKYTKEFMVTAASILNDITSAPKELKEIQKKVKQSGGNPNNITELKAKITSNLVLIKWRDGLPIEDALNQTKQLYESLVKSFYECKKLLKPKYQDNAEMKGLIYSAEGWLFGHGVWECNSSRYNKVNHMILESIQNYFEALSQQLVTAL